MDRSQTLSDIQRKLGMVPGFFKLLSDSAIETEWSLYQSVEMQPGPIPEKYRQLIGVAFSGAIPCRYCTTYHTEFAKALGATDEEVEAAAYIGKVTAGAGVYLQGLHVDWDEFKSQVQTATASIRSRTGATFDADQVQQLQTRDQVLNDIQQVLGVVPAGCQRMSDRTLLSEWVIAKRLLLGESPIPLKFRLLMALAVGSVRSDYFTALLATELAKAVGASDEELEDAVYCAKMSSGWSSYANSLQLDFEQFRSEVRQLCANARSMAEAAEPAMAGRR